MTGHTEDCEPSELIDQKLDRLAKLLKDQSSERVSLVGEILASDTPHSLHVSESPDPDDAGSEKPD